MYYSLTKITRPKALDEIFQTYRSEYKKKYGRLLPATTRPFKKITLRSEFLNLEKFGRIIDIHKELFGGILFYPEFKGNKMTMVWFCVDMQRMRTIRLGKMELHQMRKALLEILEEKEEGSFSLKRIFGKKTP